jgi:hypothetical protein
MPHFSAEFSKRGGASIELLRCAAESAVVATQVAQDSPKVHFAGIMRVW